MDNLTNYYDPRLDFGEFNHKYAHDGDEHDLLNGFCACGKPENADDSFIKMKDVFPLSDYEKEKMKLRLFPLSVYTNTLLEEYHTKLPESAGLSLDKDTLIHANLLKLKREKLIQNDIYNDQEYYIQMNNTIEEMNGLYKFVDKSEISKFYMDISDYIKNVSNILRSYQFTDVNNETDQSEGDMPTNGEEPAEDDPLFLFDNPENIKLEIATRINDETIKLKNKWPNFISLMEYEEFKKRIQKKYVNHTIVVKEGFPYSINTNWNGITSSDWTVSVDDPEVIKVFKNEDNNSLDISYLKYGTAKVTLTFNRGIDDVRQYINITVFSLVNSYELPDYDVMIKQHTIPMYKLTEEDFATLTFNFNKSYGLIHNTSVISEIGSILQDYHFNANRINESYLLNRDQLFVYKIHRETLSEEIIMPAGNIFFSTTQADRLIKEYNLKLINTWYDYFENEDKPWIQENTLYFISTEDETYEPDATVHARNIKYINDLRIEKGKIFEPENEVDKYRLEYTKILYHETEKTKPLVYRKNLHQVLNRILKEQDGINYSNHNIFKLLDLKDREKVNPYQIYAENVYYYDMDRVLPRDIKHNIQSILDWLYVKYSTEEPFTKINTIEDYVIKSEYRADLITYKDTHGLNENQNCNLQKAISKLLNKFIGLDENSYELQKNDIDTYIIREYEAKDIYYEDTYNLGINTVQDMIDYLYKYKDTNSKYPIFKKRNYICYKPLEKPEDYVEGEPLYDGNGLKVMYSLDNGDSWDMTEDVLHYSVAYEEGGWKGIVAKDSKTIFLINPSTKTHILKSDDGLIYTPIKVKDDLETYFTEIAVSKDATFIALIDNKGQLFRSNDSGNTFEIIKDARYDYTDHYKFSKMFMIDNYDEEIRDGYGVILSAHDTITGGRYGLFKDFMKYNTLYMLDKDSRIYPRVDGNYNNPVNAFVDIRSTFDKSSNELLAYKNNNYNGVKFKDLNTNNVNLNTDNLENPKTKFGTDFDLKLSLIDTSFDNTNNQMEILEMDEELNEFLADIPETNRTSFVIKSPKHGFIQLDGFNHKEIKHNDTLKRPIIHTEVFRNYKVLSDRELEVNISSEDLVYNVETYLKNKHATYGKHSVPMMCEINFEVLFNLPFNDEKRAELEKTISREFYTNTISKTKGTYNPNTGNSATSGITMNAYGSVDRIYDILYLSHIGIYHPDKSRCNFVRYVLDAARFKNSLKNAFYTIKDMQDLYNLDNSILKKIYFSEDTNIKLSENVKNIFETITENNLLKYPVNVKISIIPSKINNFKSINININRNLIDSANTGDKLIEVN